MVWFEHDGGILQHRPGLSSCPSRATASTQPINSVPPRNKGIVLGGSALPKGEGDGKMGILRGTDNFNIICVF